MSTTDTEAPVTTWDYAVVYREDGCVSTTQVTQGELLRHLQTARIYGEVLTVVRLRPGDTVRKT